MSSLLIIVKLLLCTIVCLAVSKDVRSTLTCLSSLNKEMFRLQSTLGKQSMVKKVFLKEAVFETRFETRCTRNRCSTSAVSSQNVFIPSVTTINACPKGWKSRERSCYNLFKEPTNWFQAQMNCRKYRGNLVQIQDEQESRWLIKQYPSRTGVWTDAVDLGKEGTWTFFSSGQPLKYSNWKRNEPNNANHGEDCALFDIPKGGGWDDRGCQGTYHFLCEINLN